jgi:hypothetical protein
MPASKYATKRYLIIDRCLRASGKQGCSTENILRAFRQEDINVKARTLRHDIETLRYDAVLNFHSPIIFSKRTLGYYYSDENYSIQGLINLADKEGLNGLTEKSLNEYKEMVLNELNSLIGKLNGH